VEAVFERLLDAVEGYYRDTGKLADYRSLSWDVSILAISDENASALPSGRIVVFEGMLAITTTDEYLATVLAHEIAHVLAHHGAERIADALVLQSITAVAAAYPDSQQSANMASIIHDLGRLGFLLPHNRLQESEADHLGLLILALAGYDPASAPRFWRMMMHRGGGSSSLLATHPTSELRMRQLSALVPTVMPIYRRTQKTGGYK
jgi:predicted Zn-dependent protease